MRPQAPHRSALLLLGLLMATTSGRAQDLYTRFEYGGQFSTVQLTNSSHQGVTTPGFGGRFDWNFNRRMALESQVDFFPENRQPLLFVQGGQTVQAVFGLRAKVLQTRKWSVFGLVRPGFFHFTDALFLSPTTSTGSVQQAANYFVLNLGGGIEYYPTPRWVIRADLEGNPYYIPNQTVTVSGSSTIELGKINDTTRFSVGVAYRPGALIEDKGEKNVPGNREFGPLFSTLMIAREGATEGTRTEVGFGGYASYRFYGALYLDGDVLYFPQSTSSSGPHDGGRIFQGLIGIKGGIRRNNYGIFGKARTGFQSYSQALNSVTGTSSGGFTYSYGRSTNFALDLGGIVEFYPTEKSTLRLEAGDTHIYWGTRSVNVDGTPVPFAGGKMRHSIQFIVGYGWRFW